MIGAGTVVTKDIPDNSVVIGVPAKVIGSCDAFIKRNEMLLKQSPKYDTYWTKKSIEEKKKMQKELSNRLGYDR